MRPDGIGRHGLLTESSRIDESRRWLEMLKRRRLDHVHIMRSGMREKIMVSDGGGPPVERTWLENPAIMPKSVCGMTIDFKSLHVKSQSVRRL